MSRFPSRVQLAHRLQPRDRDIVAIPRSFLYACVAVLTGAAIVIVSREWIAEQPFSDAGGRTPLDPVGDLHIVQPPEAKGSRVSLELPPDLNPSASQLESKFVLPPTAEQIDSNPEWISRLLAMTPERWAEEHRGWSKGQLIAEREKIVDYVDTSSNNQFEWRQHARAWELVAPGRTYDLSKWDALSVSRIYFEPEGGVYKITLPPEEFQELYALKGLAAWLHDTASNQP